MIELADDGANNRRERRNARKKPTTAYVGASRLVLKGDPMGRRIATGALAE